MLYKKVKQLYNHYQLAPKCQNTPYLSILYDNFVLTILFGMLMKSKVITRKKLLPVIDGIKSMDANLKGLDPYQLSPEEMKKSSMKMLRFIRKF